MFSFATYPNDRNSGHGFSGDSVQGYRRSIVNRLEHVEASFYIVHGSPIRPPSIRFEICISRILR